VGAGQKPVGADQLFVAEASLLDHRVGQLGRLLEVQIGVGLLGGLQIQCDASCPRGNR